VVGGRAVTWLEQTIRMMVKGKEKKKEREKGNRGKRKEERRK
jgi:hypothetical protein